jgi:hypothetical protein
MPDLLFLKYNETLFNKTVKFSRSSTSNEVPLPDESTQAKDNVSVLQKRQSRWTLPFALEND